MNKIQFTKEQHKAFKDLRQVFDMTNPDFIDKKFKAYIPIGLALVHMTTAEDYYRHDLEKYGAFYHQRIIDNSALFIDAIKEDRLPLLSYDKRPYEKGFWKKHFDLIDKGHEDNYFGVLIGFASYKTIYQILISDGYAPEDERVKAIKEMHEIMNHPKAEVFERFHTNDLLYLAIKYNPPLESTVHKNIQERRSYTLLNFLKDKLDYSASDGCKDLRDSKWPDRQSLWMTLNKHNVEDFKLDAKMGSIDKFFNNQKYVSFSSNKKK